jgi:hypothetical protein
MTDFRELCRELLQIEDEQPSDYADWMRRWKAAIFRARAALSAEPDGPTLQLPEQAPDEHPPSNLDRREVAAWYHGHACGWQAARAAAACGGGPAMTAPNRSPLWKVMEQACDAVIAAQHPFAREEQCLAAEIRALRDWLVPEEAEPTGMRPCGDTYSAQSIKRGERQRLRALLTTEAERAERGDG